MGSLRAWAACETPSPCMPHHFARNVHSAAWLAIVESKHASRLIRDVGAFDRTVQVRTTHRARMCWVRYGVSHRIIADRPRQGQQLSGHGRFGTPTAFSRGTGGAAVRCSSSQHEAWELHREHCVVANASVLFRYIVQQVQRAFCALRFAVSQVLLSLQRALFQGLADR